jgi:hypothetical protein
MNHRYIYPEEVDDVNEDDDEEQERLACLEDQRIAEEKAAAEEAERIFQERAAAAKILEAETKLADEMAARKAEKAMRERGLG